jgi:hypothetical protein
MFFHKGPQGSLLSSGEQFPDDTEQLVFANAACLLCPEGFKQLHEGRMAQRYGLALDLRSVEERL